MSMDVERIGYFTHMFPAHTSTFIVEEISAMRSLGADITIFAVHIPPKQKVPEEFAEWARETTAIFPVRWHLLIVEHCRAVLTRPRKYLMSLWTAMRHGGPLSLKDRVRTLLHWLEGPLLYRLIRKSDVRHVHVHFLDAAAAIMLFVNRVYGLPYSITAHGSDIFVEKVFQREKLSAARFTRVMTRYNRDALLSLFTAQGATPPSLALIPLGMEQFPESVEGKMPPAFTFLHVGRMVWQKGQRLLLEACHMLRSAGYDFQLIFVGDGELRDDISRWVDELNLSATVRLLGALPKSQVLELYRRCHCFVLSSVSEGSPAVLIEAMSEGRPVIAPALRGIPEMFSHGREGWLFETGNAAALAEAMRQAIVNADDIPNMGRLARSHAREQFDLLRNTEEFYGILRKTMSDARVVRAEQQGALSV